MITNEEIAAVGKALPKEMEMYDLGELVFLILHAYLPVEDVPELLRALADDAELNQEHTKRVMADVEKDES